jgi:phosphatidylglycerol lysyltransferase
MIKRVLHSVGPLFGLLLFGAALWVLHLELRAYHLHDILRHLEELPAWRLFWALSLTVFSYLIMAGYDALALRYIQHPLSYGKIATASFIGYAFSNNMGFGMIAGGSVRYRLYSAWGLSTLEITQVVAFCSLSLWLGFLSLGGVVFLIQPPAIPETLHLRFASLHFAGGLFVAIVGAYFLLNALRKKPFKIHDWAFNLPSTGLSLAQIALAVFDWLIAGSVLFALFPASFKLSYPGFLGIYLLAQTAGLLSQVPGGLGVFETVVVLLLSPGVPASATLGSLLAYRGIYYILPLLTAAALLGVQEVLRKKDTLRRVSRILGYQASVFAPQVLAFTTFVGGAILLFSAATPAVKWRLTWLRTFLPLPVIEMSHFLGSLVGACLLFIARGLQRRIDAAFILASVLLASGIVFSLLKGFDFEEAIALSIMLAALLPCHRYFYRKGSLITQRFKPGWIAAIITVLLCTLWLGFFSLKHVEYSNDLWWRFTLSGDAPRFLRATVGAVGVLLFFAVSRLLSPARPDPMPTSQESLDKASVIIQTSHETYANLALLGDKAFLFSRNGNAFIMYGVEGRSWVGMRDPVGKEDEWAELVWQFREMCDRYDGWTVFYEVGPARLDLYLDLGLTLLKLGEEARVPLETFSLEGGARKGLRYASHRLKKEGCLFEMIPREGIPSLLLDLGHISDAWLTDKNTREKGFSLGSFSEDYLRRFPAGIIRKNGKVVAFANVWAGGGKEELSIDLMRYLPEAPRGVMEFLFIELMLWGKEAGYQWFNLGMAPLSGIENHALAPLWSRLGAFVFRHGEHFYNLQGLRQYKEKFDPVWESKYLACPGGLSLPRILANIASLISGGMKGVIAK